MRPFIICTLSLAAFCAVQSLEAQPPGERPQGERGPGGGPPNGGPPGRGPQGGSVDPSAAVEKIMTLDVNGDHMLTIAEVKDARLENLLKRADKNSDGNVTVEELTDEFTAEAAQSRNSRGGGPGGGFGGPGESGYGNPGGFGGPPGFGGPGRGMRRPGEILPPFMLEELQLNEAQRTEMAALQTDVDARLKKILTEEQMQQLSQRPRPPQGRGPGNPDQGGPPGDRPPGGGRGGNRPPSE